MKRKHGEKSFVGMGKLWQIGKKRLENEEWSMNGFSPSSDRNERSFIVHFNQIITTRIWKYLGVYSSFKKWDFIIFPWAKDCNIRLIPENCHETTKQFTFKRDRNRLSGFKTGLTHNTGIILQSEFSGNVSKREGIDYCNLRKEYCKINLWNSQIKTSGLLLLAWNTSSQLRSITSAISSWTSQ